MNLHLYGCINTKGSDILSNIKELRQAYSEIYTNMPISKFIDAVGHPDSSVGSLNNGVLSWSDNIYKGLFKGKKICRKVVLFTKDGYIVQFFSENLNVSN